jgi:TRAP-type C4-dicarboxylate transport system permease small subunit
MHEVSELPAPLKLISRLIDIIIAVSGITIIAIVFLNAVLRFVINIDSAWSREIVTFLMLWTVFLGCAAAAARSAHMRVTEIVALILPPLGRWWLEIAVNIVTCAVLVLIIWYGARIAIRTWDQETSVLYWPVGLLYAAMPVGTFLTLIFVGNDLIALFRPSTAGHDTGRRA